MDSNDRLKEIERQIREQDKKQQEAEDKAKKHEAYAVMWLVFVNLGLFVALISGEHVSAIGALIIGIGDLIALHKLNVF